MLVAEFDLLENGCAGTRVEHPKPLLVMGSAGSMSLRHTIERKKPMTEYWALLGILGALLLGAVSPGPSFVLVSRVAMNVSRRDGLAAAVGMGVGGAIFATLAVLGIATILIQAEWLYIVCRILGGSYLIYLGIRTWLGASQPLRASGTTTMVRPSATRYFSVGLLTQLSNPKTAVVYASIFSALLPATVPTWLFLSLPPLVFALEASWYSLVALALSTNGPRSLNVRWKAWVDRTAGVIIGALGVRLISSTLWRS